MKLIFAQGNPGPQYAPTRHNIGFMVLDAFSEAHSGTWKENSKANADTCELRIGEEKVLLVKPHSYYNETGLVARKLVDFYKLDPTTDVLVAHDELALPFGTIRIREKGSDAGNNGIKSLNAHLGPDYARLRIGVWNELRDRINDADFVLSRFTQKESTHLLDTVFPHTNAFIEQFIQNGLESHSIKTLLEK